jgi:AraC-like DNA-binding protein
VSRPEQTDAARALGTMRSFVEGYPRGGRIERHVHDEDQLALISGSAAVIETDESYVVHPLSKALWLPAGVHHGVYSARPFWLHSLYFEAGSVRPAKAPQVLGLDALARELVLLLCTVSRPSQRGPRHAHAFALLTTLLAEAGTESFVLPRPRSERARKLADHLANHPDDGRPLEIVADEIGGASLRTFERLFVEETGMTLAVWRRHGRLLTSLTLLAEGRTIAEAAHAVGYDSAAAFSTAFKQCFGVTPKAYAGGDVEA